MNITELKICPRTLTTTIQTESCKIKGRLLRRTPRPQGYELVFALDSGGPEFRLFEEVTTGSKRKIPIPEHFQSGT